MEVSLVTGDSRLLIKKAVIAEHFFQKDHTSQTIKLLPNTLP